MRKFGMFWIMLVQSSILFAAPISEQIFLDVAGNHKVYLEISGQSRDVPLLLYVHGGPGNVVLGLLPFQSGVGPQLEKDFLVAYLHQRGAGKSSPVADASFADYVNDIEVTVDFLLAKYRKDKVFLVGHSTGGMLTIMYTKSHQDKVARLVLMSTAMNVNLMLRDSYQSILEWAQKEKMAQPVADLSQIDQKFDTWDDFIRLSKWANQARGGILRRVDMAEFLKEHNVERDYPDWAQRRSISSRALSQELLNLNLDDVAVSFDIPALFVSGALDTIVTDTTVRRDYANYRGKKQLVILPDSHHAPFIDQPDALAQAIGQFLKH